MINGAFQREDVIDELSLVVAPVVAGETGETLFENGEMEGYSLRETKTYEESVLWLKYKKND